MIAILLAPVLATVLILASGSAAMAAGKHDSSSEKAVSAKKYVIVQPSSGVAGKDGAIFYRTGRISADTLVVFAEADGSIPAALDVSKSDRPLASTGEGDSAAAVGILATRSYSANSTSWSGIYVGSYIIGFNDAATLSYYFTAQPGISQQNVAQGRGFYRGYNGSQFGLWSKFYPIGTATAKTAGAATVPWGNVAASTQFMAKCATTTVCAGSWQP